MEWKEYFHALYDLVVVPYDGDNTVYKILINELYKYYQILKPPRPLSRPVEIVDRVQSLFNQLKKEHKKMIIPRLTKKMNKNMEFSKARRLEHLRAYDKLEFLETRRTIFNKILEWTEKV
jgi:hypothetical protein